MDQLEDELESLENLDEEDMLENTEDALAVDYSQVEQTESVINQEYLNVDLSKAVEAAILKNEEEQEAPASIDQDLEDDKMTDNSQLKDKEQEINSILTDDTTYITKGTTIKGNIETDGSVDVIGSVEGNISCGGKLIVGGTIVGNITAGEVYANAAKLEGEVICDGSVKIGVGTVVVGNVNATSAVIAGAVNGDIDVHGPVIVDSTAVIMGNIKSRSVQINNGAVIEGFCSQCYSEIDVKSFFE
ncbi:MAG: polymer-forming cytoskeletal protein [Lachnospiraceae bacterium]|nr:polymer-forming cytoskeletal protein [Lachnospiraceae bacterium]